EMMPQFPPRGNRTGNVSSGLPSGAGPLGPAFCCLLTPSCPGDGGGGLRRDSPARMVTQSDAEADDEAETVFFEGRPALVPGVGVLVLVLLTLGLWLIPRWWSSRGCHYRLTSRRVVV